MKEEEEEEDAAILGTFGGGVCPTQGERAYCATPRPPLRVFAFKGINSPGAGHNGRRLRWPPDAVPRWATLSSPSFGGKVSILISRYTIVAFGKREARLKEKGTLLLENKYTDKRFRYLK